LLVVQDVLWSDPGPDDDKGVEVPNYDRGGAGCVYGGGMVSAFLAANGLKRLVRSHQMVAEGTACVKLRAPFEGVFRPSECFELWTVFSASR
jgi:hypothetical protein